MSRCFNIFSSYCFLSRTPSNIKYISFPTSISLCELLFKKINSNCSQIKRSEASFGKYKYETEVENEINVQINREQEASQAYLAIAGYFGNVKIARKGCYNYFLRMYEEESDHAKDLINYQLMRGGTLRLHEIKPAAIQEKSMLSFFEKALKMEIDITEKLQFLVKVAEKHNDHQCADYIVSKFLKEQMESINEISNMTTTLRNLGNQENSLFLFDLELEKKFAK